MLPVCTAYTIISNMFSKCMNKGTAIFQTCLIYYITSKHEVRDENITWYFTCKDACRSSFEFVLGTGFLTLVY